MQYMIIVIDHELPDTYKNYQFKLDRIIPNALLNQFSDGLKNFLSIV